MNTSAKMKKKHKKIFSRRSKSRRRTSSMNPEPKSVNRITKNVSSTSAGS
jgi:hypothetical protein